MAPGWGPHALEPMTSRSHDWPRTRGLRGVVCPSGARASQGRGLCTCSSRVCRLEAAAATALEHGAARPLSHTGAHVTWSSHPAVSGQEGKGCTDPLCYSSQRRPSKHTQWACFAVRPKPALRGNRTAPAHKQGPSGTRSPASGVMKHTGGETLSLARELGARTRGRGTHTLTGTVRQDAILCTW